MIDQNSIVAVAEAVATNPKFASSVAGATTAMGIAAHLDLIQNGVGLASIAIGCVVGVFVIRVHSIKYKLLKRAWDQGETPKDL